MIMMMLDGNDDYHDDDHLFDGDDYDGVLNRVHHLLLLIVLWSIWECSCRRQKVRQPNKKGKASTSSSSWSTSTSPSTWSWSSTWSSPGGGKAKLIPPNLISPGLLSSSSPSSSKFFSDGATLLTVGLRDRFDLCVF